MENGFIDLPPKLECKNKSKSLSLEQNNRIFEDNYKPINIIKEHINGHNFENYKKSFGDRSINLLEFIEIILSNTDVSNDETVYIVSGIKKLFEEICNDKSNTATVSFKEFVDYIIKQMGLDDNSAIGLNSYKNLSNCLMKFNIDKKTKNRISDAKLYQKQQDLIYTDINTNDFKTNVHLFRTPVKLCLFDSYCNIFVIVTEEAKEIIIFNHTCAHLKTLCSKITEQDIDNRITSISFSCSDKRVK